MSETDAALSITAEADRHTKFRIKHIVTLNNISPEAIGSRHWGNVFALSKSPAETYQRDPNEGRTMHQRCGYAAVLYLSAILCCPLAVSAAFARPAAGEPVALVIGKATCTCTHAGVLTNPANDASDGR